MIIKLPYMLIKCAYCGLDMGRKPCDVKQHKMVSHGICPTCEAKVLKEIEEYEKEIENENAHHS